MRHRAIIRGLCATGLLAILVALWPAATVRATNPYLKWKYEDMKFNPPVPERFVLDNGLVVFFLRDTTLPVVTLTALVRAGSVYVPEEKAGLGGIAGDVLVTGGTTSRTPDEVDQQLEFLGIRWEGSVDLESSDFSLHCLAKDFAAGLALYADLLLHPGFDSAKFQLALDNSKEELRRQNDSPGQIISREFSKLVYGHHPYGRFATPQTLDAISRQDVIDFYRAYFRPNTTILAMSGDLTSAAVKNALTRTFGGWSQADVTLPQIPAPTAPDNPGVYLINKDLNQTNIRFGHLGIDRHNSERHAVRVMNDILGGGGFTARMIARVRSDSGWAYSVGTRFTAANQPGLFYASCQTKTQTTAKTLALMQWVVADLLQNGITDEELATAKESILNSDVFNYETPGEIVERYATQEFYGFPADQLKQDVEAIRAVTKADVERVARKYLDPKHYTVLAVGKVEKFDAPLSRFGRVTTITLEEAP
ncbi:MAG: insulinase family protein [candidate division Zixibacteria bacterium]|nr:insulinase family protein [candidate division Zixibacteria bacterium]